MTTNKPVFPVTVTWKEDGEQEIFKNEIDAACTLEWFDSRDDENDVTVVDSNGDAVVLVVKELEIKLFQLA